jgi:hypothetical protein
MPFVEHLGASTRESLLHTFLGCFCRREHKSETARRDRHRGGVTERRRQDKGNRGALDRQLKPTPDRAESTRPRQSERSHERTQPHRCGRGLGNAGTASWSRGQGRARRWDELRAGKKAGRAQRRAPARGYGRAEERGPRKELAGDPEGDGARRQAWLCAAWASALGKIHSWARSGRTGSSTGGGCVQGAKKKLLVWREISYWLRLVMAL